MSKKSESGPLRQPDHDTHSKNTTKVYRHRPPPQQRPTRPLSLGARYGHMQIARTRTPP